MARFFEGAHLWQAVRILAACALAYVAARLIGLSEFYWALVTAVGVTQPALPETLAAGRDRALGTLIGALAGLAVIAAGQWGASTFALFWVALVPLAILTAMKPTLRLSCVTLVIVVLVPAPGNPFARPFEHSRDSRGSAGVDSRLRGDAGPTKDLIGPFPGSARGYDGGRLSRSRISLPVLKKGTNFSVTGTLSPVRGLRPVRACRCLVENAPNPRSSTRSPRANA